MDVDFAALAPVARELERAALPTLATILKTAAPFPFNLFAGGAVSMVAQYLGVDPTPQAVVAKVQEDPAAAAKVLQPVEDHYADQVQAAQAQLDSELRDAQDARAAEVRYVEAKSPLSMVPAYYTAAVTALFFIVVTVLLVALIWPPSQEPKANTLVYSLLTFFLGALTVEQSRCGQFWMGSSHGSKEKDQTLSELARTPKVTQGPGSKVTGGLDARGR